MKNYECIYCGEPLNNPNHNLCPSCYQDEFYDKCNCGNSKKIEHDLCKSCYNEKVELEQKEKYGSGICPICGNEFRFSSFLHNQIPNEKTRLIANLITHYRHIHQTSWNKSCHYISKKYGEDAYLNSKIEHNNRAKRQILRKCKKWIFDNGIKGSNFLDLKDNDINTIKLIDQTFSSIK